MNSSLDLFAYYDYRQYLSDWLKEMKAIKPKFSHRYLLAKMGVSSSGFLSNIITKKRNLPLSHVSKLAEALQLDKKSTFYFENLVAFNQSKTLADKNRFFRNLLSIKPLRIKKIEESQYELFSKWHYVAIRELLFFFPFRNDYEALAKKMLPSIKTQDAKEAIEVLTQLGLIEKDGKGIYRQKENLIGTGDEVKSLQVANFQVATMELAKTAIDRIPHPDRDISVLTVTLSDTSFLAAVEEIRLLRKRILKMALDEIKPDRIFQCNLQLFPLTRK